MSSTFACIDSGLVKTSLDHSCSRIRTTAARELGPQLLENQGHSCSRIRATAARVFLQRFNRRKERY